jgi:thymidylate synthase (FAD)
MEGALNYIKKLAKQDIYDDGIGYVELWDFSKSNLNENSRIETISLVASQCYGKIPKDAAKMVERLKTESNGGPTSSFEFISFNGEERGIERTLRNNPCLAFYETMIKRFGWKLDGLIADHKETIATFRVKVPIFIARQIMRHRQFAYQELSRRYCNDDKVKIEFWKPSDKFYEFNALYENSCNKSVKEYKELLAEGIRPEIARAVLPQSVYTEFWWQGNLEAWRNYFALRLDAHTQLEHRRAAEAMAELLKDNQPEFKYDPKESSD